MTLLSNYSKSNLKTQQVLVLHWWCDFFLSLFQIASSQLWETSIEFASCFFLNINYISRCIFKIRNLTTQLENKLKILLYAIFRIHMCAMKSLILLIIFLTTNKISGRQDYDNKWKNISCISLYIWIAVCPPNEPLVNCFLDPCMLSSCQAYSNAKCM